MADRITDEVFDALPLSQQLEFVASHLQEADEASFAALKSWDITDMLMHCLVMSRHAAGMERRAEALERELAQCRDDERLQLLRIETAFEQAAAPDSNVVSWPVIARNVHINVYGHNTPKGAA